MTSPFETRSPLDLELPDRAGRGRRHVHRRLLGLERDERRVERDLVAGLHQDVDDLDVLEIAEVGNADFDQPWPRARPVRPSPGSAVSGSMSNFFIALVHRRHVELAFVGERLQRRERDVAPVDFEEAAQLRARIAAAVAVGAEHVIAARHPLPDLVGHDLHVVGGGDERTGAIARHWRTYGCGGGSPGCSRFRRSTSSASRRSSEKLVTLNTSAGTP